MSDNDPNAGLVKIRVELSDDAGVSGESFWALPLGNGVYQVRNMPFFVDGLNLNDVVRCHEEDDQKPLVVELLEWGGYSSLRVHFASALTPDEEIAILREAAQRGAQFERGGKGLAMVAVSPDADYEAIYNYLLEQEEAGRLMFGSNDPDDEEDVEI
jgi:hypothetical protein